MVLWLGCSQMLVTITLFQCKTPMWNCILTLLGGRDKTNKATFLTFATPPCDHYNIVLFHFRSHLLLWLHMTHPHYQIENPPVVCWLCSADRQIDWLVKILLCARELGSSAKAVSLVHRPRCPNPLAHKVDYLHLWSLRFYLTHRWNM